MNHTNLITPIFWVDKETAYLFCINKEGHLAYYKTKTGGSSWEDGVIIAKKVIQFSVIADWEYISDNGSCCHIAYVKGNKLYKSVFEIHLDTCDDRIYGGRKIRTLWGVIDIYTSIVKLRNGDVYIGVKYQCSGDIAYTFK